MSCPSWFPAALLSRPEVLVAVRVGRLAGSAAPPVGPFLTALSAGLEVGAFMARAGCDAPRAVCLWATQQRDDLDVLLHGQEWWVVTARTVYATAGLLGLLQGLYDALGAVPDCANVDAVDDGEGETSMEPMLIWSGENVPYASGDNSLALAYSHLYQRAIRDAFAAASQRLGGARVAASSLDLRPWLAEQTALDIRYVTAHLAHMTSMLAYAPTRDRRQKVEALREALRRLDVWRASALGEPRGPWSQETVLRVVRASQPVPNLPVEVGAVDVPPPGEESSLPAWLAPAGLVAGFLFLK